MAVLEKNLEGPKVFRERREDGGSGPGDDQMPILGGDDQTPIGR